MQGPHGASRTKAVGPSGPRRGAPTATPQHQIQEGEPAVAQDINVLALVKGEERYVFLYSDENRAEVLRTLGRFASNPELSFTWYDAAVLSQRVRQETPPRPAPLRFHLEAEEELL
jgi:hypothetical protein